MFVFEVLSYVHDILHTAFSTTNSVRHLLLRLCLDRNHFGLSFVLS
jgi:hypothetical protein